MTPFEQPGAGPSRRGPDSSQDGSGPRKELVIVTGISGAGKASALKAFEDLGYHAVDNLPLELLPGFAELVEKSAEIHSAAIVVDVREGQTLSSSLAATGIFPELAVDMVEVGESTGALQEMLNSLADFYDEEIETNLGRFVTLIEPILLIIMGLVIAGLLLSLYMPLFNMSSALG